MKKLFLSATAAVAFALAGCGDDESDTASGPASVMPADAPFYIEATVRPEGEQADDLEAFLSELGELPVLGQVGDPGDFLIQQLESQAESAGVDFSYAEDVEPWLGERMGVVGSVGAQADSDIFTFAIETTDEEAALDSLQRLLEETGAPTEEGEYEGVTYVAPPGDEFRLGAFSGHVVFASQAEFEAAVDASEGESLASSDKLESALESRDDGTFATVYFDLAHAEEFGDTPEDSEDLALAKEIAPEFFDGAVTISAGVSAGDQVFLDSSVPLFEGQPEVGASQLLETAAGDALGAFALEDVGSFAPPIADLLERANEAGADLDDFPEEGLDAALESETGVSIDEAAEAIGDMNFWVRGELPDRLEVAGEIEAADPDVAADLIEAIEREIDEEGSAKLGSPVGGSDVGFSALQQDAVSGELECTSIGDTGECVPATGTTADLPFVNLELDGDVIRYGFFRDEKAAAAADSGAGGDFGEGATYVAGAEALGDDFEYIGSLDLAPILDEFAGGPSVGDALLGGSPEELILPFLADKLGVVATGVRYEDDTAIQRYVLQLAE